MSNPQTFRCGCGSCFSSAANIKRHQKLCKKANEPIDVSVGMSNAQLKSAISRLEDKVDILLNNDEKLINNIDITQLASSSETKPKSQTIKIISSKPSITFEELCMKDYATKRNATKLREYAVMGMHGIPKLFNNILSKYTKIPFKYVNTPTKKTQNNDCTIHMFEDNISIYKDKTWKPMTRDDTEAIFYNLYVALENNYSYPSEDDKDFDETLHKFYEDVNEDNIYSNAIVEIKDELIDIIKTYG